MSVLAHLSRFYTMSAPHVVLLNVRICVYVIMSVYAGRFFF